MRVNVGCGRSPTKGWRNFDNSPSLRLARCPFFPRLLFKVGILDKAQYEFVQFARRNSIEYGDAVRRLPISDSSVDVLYSSHMIEHLDREEAILFLRECQRILKSEGILRLAVPDLKKLVKQYLQDDDADAFVAGTLLAQSRPRGLSKRISMMLVGPRNHLWMYDGLSLSKFLRSQGLRDPAVMGPGETTIGDAQALNLSERSSESVYVEAVKP